MSLVHVDTDIGGDPDDLCALAMLLGWAGVDLAGITTSTDQSGVRAGMASYALSLAGREDVPVAAGAGGSLGGFRIQPGFPDLSRHWPETITPEPARPGATIVVIGPWTNLAMAEVARPGSLSSARVVAMGGYIGPPRAGLGSWTPDTDYNVQQDTVAARILWERSEPLLVPLAAGLEVRLRRRHLSRLREGGRLARLIVRQGELHASEEDMAAMARRHSGLPEDLINFHYDPLACAVAAGWDGATVETPSLMADQRDGPLTFTREPGGRETRVVTDVDGPRFEEEWLRAVMSVG